MLRLVTFGGLSLERGDGSAPPRLRPQRLAILAVLAHAGDHGISREGLSAIFWPDAEDARHSLRQALYALRHELGTDVIRSDSALALDSTAISSDVNEFRSAISSGDRLRAASVVAGPFLRGFHIVSSPEFERWRDEERAVLTADASKLLLKLAKDAEAQGDNDSAREYWRRLNILDPLSGRFALGLLKAMAGSGDRAGALAFARAHERLVRRELESDPDPEIRKMEAELRSIPSPSVKRARVVVTENSGEAFDATLPPATTPSLASAPTASLRTRWRRRGVLVGSAAVVVLGSVAAVYAFNDSPKKATFAVGMIREEGVPDTLRIGGVLTDMLATNLARVAGLSVLSNSRLFELMLPGEDTLVAGYSDAARRAGATEILQGRLLPGPRWTLAMEVQRVDLATGLVKGAYRVSAGDRYELVDSMTSQITRDLRAGSPSTSIAEVTTQSPVAYRFYEEGLRAYNQYDESIAARLMRAALNEDSTFAMAAYYAELTAQSDQDRNALRARAIRLAGNAPDRERLTIRADLMAENMDPRAPFVAESLAKRFPTDPRAFQLLAKSKSIRGDFGGAIAALERAVALDSAAEPADRQGCKLCNDFSMLADTYFWADSVSAAERTARRAHTLRPKWHNPWDIMVRVSAMKGDSAAVRGYLRRFSEASPTPNAPMYIVTRTILAEDYDRAEQILQPLIDSPRDDERIGARWYEHIILRNQGRINDAMKLTYPRKEPSDVGLGLASLANGDIKTATGVFVARARGDISDFAPTLQARIRAWNLTLIGMTRIAAHDTAEVRKLADSVEYWGARSLYGRDRRAHHYLRGMLAEMSGRDDEALSHLSQAIHSRTNGFTLVNYEMGKIYLRRNRPADAIAITRSALFGDVDGPNLYVTRTDLHDLMA
jgi:DNA-binding SARP family transcriptional activator/tetratricopeptide (TPR) repeat protein